MTISEQAAAQTPMSDHVAKFWRLLETEHVRILIDMRREVGVDAPDGPVVYWDSASFGDDIAKAIAADRADALSPTAGQEWREPEGWQLVPKELTEDMAAEIECSNGTDEGWQRALAACPPLPAAPKQPGAT
jgi:hypothetical protein